MLLIKQKQKNSKLPKHIWMKPYLKTRSDKSAFANIILELPLTNAIDHTLTFIHWLLIHLILLTLTILTKFHRKKAVLDSLFYNVASLQAWNLIKKKILHRYFPLKFEKFLRALVLNNICEHHFCVLITSS